jgi:hypothetical protein
MRGHGRRPTLGRGVDFGPHHSATMILSSRPGMPDEGLWPNHPAAGKAGIALPFQGEHDWPGLPEPGR